MLDIDDNVPLKTKSYFTNEQIKSIPLRYLSGESAQSIANDFGATKTQIFYQLKLANIKVRGTKKQICKNGHNRDIVGVYKNGSCKKCAAEKTAKYDPIKMTAYKKAYKYKNKEVWRQSTVNWRERNPESSNLSQRKSLLKKYGMTIEDFAQLFAKQKGCCAICSRNLLKAQEFLGL